MAMVDTKDLLYHAYRNRYAVGAFGIVSLDFLQAVIQAAEQARSPVILNIAQPQAGLFDVELLMSAVVRAARRSSVPVAVHFDHCTGPGTVQTAIRLGCNSVMYTAAESFPVNVENTRRVVELAHGCGIPVEGELGCAPAIAAEADEAVKESSIFTPVTEAGAYVERTGVDFLAISIGTAHGRAKNRSRLDFHRLARINEAVRIPLVIHGGAGLSDEQYHKLIDHGVAKIKYCTGLAELAVRQLSSNLQTDRTSYPNLFDGLRDRLADEVQRCMQVWGSAGRAAEVQIQCRPWRNVEHVIVYNTNSSDPAAVEEMLGKGKQQLQQVPGVLDVQTGKAVNSHGKYRYCWLIRFAHEMVIENYKQHSLHVAYADKHFRPLAADRITNDYEILDDMALQRQLPSPPKKMRA